MLKQFNYFNDVDSQGRKVGIFRLHVQRAPGYRWVVWKVVAASLEEAIEKLRTRYPTFHRIEPYSDDIACAEVDRILKISEHPANVRYRERLERRQKTK